MKANNFNNSTNTRVYKRLKRIIFLSLYVYIIIKRKGKHKRYKPYLLQCFLTSENRFK